MRHTKPRSIRMEDTTWDAAKELAWRSRLSLAEWFRRTVANETERTAEPPANRQRGIETPP